MDTPSLSSNWKKLQPTLKSQTLPTTEQRKALKQNDNQARNGTARPLKRKAESSQPLTRSGFANKKRPTLFSTQVPKKQGATPRRSAKMGSYLSTPAEPAATSNEADTTGNGEGQTESVKTKKRAPTAGKFVAIDCEMVGTTSTTVFSVKSSNNNDFSILARVSVVSYAQEVLYDTYVLPPSGVQVTDYRTKHSGITPWHLNKDNETTKPRPFEQVQEEVSALLQGRILVGHAISNDLAVLGLSHPKRSIRDTSSYPKYRALAAATRRDGTPGKGRKPALKMLTSSVLGYEIQNDDSRGHDSVEDAKATMALFQREKKGFEDEAVKRFGRAALSASAAPRQVKAARAPPENGNAGAEASDDRGSDIVDDEDNDMDEVDEVDEEADEAEVANAELLDVGARVKKTKRKKKKKGKYRK